MPLTLLSCCNANHGQYLWNIIASTTWMQRHITKRATEYVNTIHPPNRKLDIISFVGLGSREFLESLYSKIWAHSHKNRIRHSAVTGKKEGMNAEDIAVERKKLVPWTGGEQKTETNVATTRKTHFLREVFPCKSFFLPFFWSLLKDTAKLELKISLWYSYFRVHTSIPLIIQGVISKNFRR